MYVVGDCLQGVEIREQLFLKGFSGWLSSSEAHSPRCVSAGRVWRWRCCLPVLLPVKLAPDRLSAAYRGM